MIQAEWSLGVQLATQDPGRPPRRCNKPSKLSDARSVATPNLAQVQHFNHQPQAKRELQGWRPSLIVSPMLVEDGAQMAISNLDLEGLENITLHLFKTFPDAAIPKSQHGVAHERCLPLREPSEERLPTVLATADRRRGLRGQLRRTNGL